MLVCPSNNWTTSSVFLSFVCPQRCDEDEAFKLLQRTKEDQTDVAANQGDEDLIIAEYESDDDSKSKSRCERPFNLEPL